jgi:hypothetical protein
MEKKQIASKYRESGKTGTTRSDCLSNFKGNQGSLLNPPCRETYGYYRGIKLLALHPLNKKEGSKGNLGFL